MSIHLKVRLFKGKTHSDGTHPIQLQFYLNGKIRRKGIFSCMPEDWDIKKCRVKAKVKNSAYINALISEKYTEYERELIKVMNGEVSETFFNDNMPLTLDYILGQELERYRREIKPMTEARLKCYKKELKTYLKSDSLLLKSINLRWFEKYASFLTTNTYKDGEIVRKANIGHTAQKKLKDIRRIIEKWSQTPLSNDVKKFKIQVKKPVKQKLNSAEMASLENLTFNEKDRLLEAVRDVFLMQIYLRGCRIGSLLQAYSYQFTDGRYAANNSAGKNNVDCKLIPKAQAIVDKYKGKHERLFPLYKHIDNPELSEFENKRRAIKHKESCTTVINKYLKVIAKRCEITKPLSSHIARHTFARMAIDKINNPMVTMELLGHSSLAVHQQYLNDIRKEDVLDAAADDIFG